MTTSSYIPIDCDQHSVLELLAMRRARVVLRARDEVGRELTLLGVIEDVLTRSGAEYLVLRDQTACEHSIRLDRLEALFDQTGGLLWRQKTGSS